ncbi:Aste57867_12958 [Aphanomyces stellatus]|uniref:Aste57867_12958 protein n=1 Tax=Aphanomyces stellatus TaxID=120398 RepID=A0A485KWY5_9STRA|nr:hypothetical protein As57867_012910 [Aphanomyces stellatus]VFT89804.1 Aste57867_12958 [Aphanomyces stellatus]
MASTAARSPTKLALSKAFGRVPPVAPLPITTNAFPFLDKPCKSPVKKAMESPFHYNLDDDESDIEDDLCHDNVQSEGQDTAEASTTTTQLRTELLDRVLRLLDKDDSVVEFVASLVDRVATLPLQDATMRAVFLAQLQAAAAASPTKSTAASSSSSSSVARSSGRARCLNVRNCRSFILACANEIVELDENDPAFDYAETCVDSDEFGGVVSRRAAAVPDYAESVASTAKQDVASRFRQVLHEHYDYASTASSMACSSDCGRDDTCLQEAFSRLHEYAFEMAKKRQVFAQFKREMPMEPSSPPKPRRVESKQSPLKDIASKYNTFEVLKANCNRSPLNMGRKKRAFYKFKVRHDVETQDMATRATTASAWTFTTPLAKDYLLCGLILALAVVIYDEFKLW